MIDRHGNDVKPGDRVRLCGERLRHVGVASVTHVDDESRLARIDWKREMRQTAWATPSEIELVTEETRK